MQTRLASPAFHLREREREGDSVCNISLTADLHMHIFFNEIWNALNEYGTIIEVIIIQLKSFQRLLKWLVFVNCSPAGESRHSTDGLVLECLYARHLVYTDHRVR